jgi:hypothetical protein
VTAIHRAEQKGAEVKWNDKINKRQFDVTIRFQAGAYPYLTVVECRDQRAPLKVERIESLVTKSHDAKANKAIMVSSSGFQKGCYVVAQRYGVELFTMQEVHDLPEDLLEKSISIPILVIHSFALHCGAEELVLPEERNILPFLVKDTFIESHNHRVTIESILDDIHSELEQSGTSESKSYRIDFRKGSVVTLPDIKSGNTLEFIQLPIEYITFKYQITPGLYLKDEGLDPYLLRRRYEFKNAVSGEGKIYSPKELEVGFDTIFRPGSFYFDVHSEFRYFCHKIDGDLIKLAMLEGYQHGRHLQVTFTVLRENARSYAEITDESEINRLKAMLRTLRNRRGASFEGEEILDA